MLLLKQDISLITINDKTLDNEIETTKKSHGSTCKWLPINDKTLDNEIETLMCLSDRQLLRVCSPINDKTLDNEIETILDVLNPTLELSSADQR